VSASDEILDLTGVPCPQNSARALMVIEFMDPGQRLELFLDDGEPYQNVPESLEIEGHVKLLEERRGAGWRMVFERGEE
jgi:TusA-related sulfurtransferase